MSQPSFSPDGPCAGVRNGDEVLDKLGITKSFSDAVRLLAFLGVGHLAASAIALVVAAPRFARVQPRADPTPEAEPQRRAARRRVASRSASPPRPKPSRCAAKAAGVGDVAVVRAKCDT